MSTINGHTTRAVGTVLTAAIYNTDHLNHVTNAQTLNTDKMEGTPPPVVDGHAVVWNGTAGNVLRTSGFFPVNKAGDTITGALAVGGALTTNGNLLIDKATPLLTLRETGGAADAKKWRTFTNATQLLFDAINDADTVSETWLAVTRSGVNVTIIDFVSAAATELRRAGNVVWDQNNVGTQTNALTEDTTPDLVADFALTYDVSAALPKKVLLNKIAPVLVAGSGITVAGSTISINTDNFEGVGSYSMLKLTIIVSLAAGATTGVANLTRAVTSAGAFTAGTGSPAGTTWRNMCDAVTLGEFSLFMRTA